MSGFSTLTTSADWIAIDKARYVTHLINEICDATASTSQIEKHSNSVHAKMKNDKHGFPNRMNIGVLNNLLLDLLKMRFMKSRLMIFLAIMMSSSLCCADPSFGQEIWFSPMDPFFRPALGTGGSSDFMKLFMPQSQWTQTSKYVSAFKLLPRFLRLATDEELILVIQELKKKKISLAIEFGILHQKANCGHLEGHDPDQISIAKRLQRLGADVAFFAADEPLYFGHSFDGVEGCHTPIKDLAKEAAETAHAFHEIFPSAKFIDIEPISNFTERDWVESIIEWQRQFAEAYGEKFYAVYFDINWDLPWQDRVSEIYKSLQINNMRIGVICNGTSQDKTDDSWLRHAWENCANFKRQIGRNSEIIIFQSWNSQPTHVLPEESADTFTHLLLAFARENGLRVRSK